MAGKCWNWYRCRKVETEQDQEEEKYFSASEILSWKKTQKNKRKIYRNITGKRKPSDFGKDDLS